MKVQKPGIIALRAVNQYRQRDVFTYLALRYYLENNAARTDQWARRFCVESVIRRTTQPYSSVQHFKEMTEAGPCHRAMYFPSAGEALAESALIDACSRSSGGGFSLSSRVYSYNPVAAAETSGIFDHYMVGFRRRHEAITSACMGDGGKVVAFMDIKKFYPSITRNVAECVWKRACESSNIDASFRILGEKLIHDHSAVAAEKSGGSGLLTGPMFSHLLANLLLAKVDSSFDNADVSYCRYVDDIALIGSPQDVRKARRLIESMLSELGLELHGEDAGKSMEISAADWLLGAEDDDEWQQEDSWMRLVGDIKKLLVHRPDLKSELGVRFAAQRFRIPILDYSTAAHEAKYAEKFVRPVDPAKYFGSTGVSEVGALVDRAKALKSRYSQELEKFQEEYVGSEGFQAKRLLPKIRYRLGRLAYLSDQGELRSMGDEIKEPTLALHGEVVKAIATGVVDRVLEMGRNAAQAVAQPMAMAQNRVVVSKQVLSDLELQSLAVFKVNGVEVEHTATHLDPQSAESELIRFVEEGPDIGMMQSRDPFLAQLASLHGLSVGIRHAEVLETPFDPLEEIALDALDPAGGSL